MARWLTSDIAFLMFLGELRAGADAASAAVVASMTREEGARHAAIEAQGGYAAIVAIEPSWSIFGDKITFERKA